MALLFHYSPSLLFPVVVESFKRTWEERAGKNPWDLLFHSCNLWTSDRDFSSPVHWFKIFSETVGIREGMKRSLWCDRLAYANWHNLSSLQSLFFLPLSPFFAPASCFPLTQEILLRSFGCFSLSRRVDDRRSSISRLGKCQGGCVVWKILWVNQVLRYFLIWIFKMVKESKIHFSVKIW